jgi:hypothetical protein
MKINIIREPPVDIFRNRGKYSLIAISFLTLSVCGMLLAAYAIFSDTQHSEKLETVAFALFVGPVLAFSYFGEKLQAYKRLTQEQVKELADLGRKHPKIKTYCALVAEAGRQPILAEYEACQAWGEDASRKNRPRSEGRERDTH